MKEKGGNVSFNDTINTFYLHNMAQEDKFNTATVNHKMRRKEAMKCFI